MALTLGDNFSYMGAKPLDARLKYDTVAAMKAMADSTLYDGCLAYCAATDKTYQWKSTNTVDATLGRWREFSSGGGASDLADLGDVDLSSPSNDDVLKYDGTSGKWVNGQGGGSSYTAGDGIDITNNEISTDNMPSSDMSEVISPLPGVMSRRMKYSTEEQVIGEWIDGKPVYQKVCVLSTAVDLPSNTWVDTSFSIPNAQIISAVTRLLCQGVNVTYGYIGAKVELNTLRLMSIRDVNITADTIIVQYTKTTD